MTVELKPEMERIIQDQLASGRFSSVDEVLATALAGLAQRSRSNLDAVARMIEFSTKHSVRLPPGETVEGMVREGHRY
jgi:Arc/MetJ-type ribon-helix-helix transcriptional regulator